MWILWTVLVMLGLALVFGLGLGFASKYMAVNEDERIDAVEKMLPGYNCGACGSAGCRDFANLIIKGEIHELSRCKPGKKEVNFDPIIEFLKNHPNEDGSNLDVKI